MAREPKTEVLLLRSGMTEWDEQRRIQGRTDLPLSVSGRRAIEPAIRDAADSLKGDRVPTAIHSAPDEASRATAEILADAVGSRVRVIENLQTMDLGLWEGLLEDEIESRYPSACRLWQDQPALVQPPKGESFVEADARVRLALARVLDRGDGRPAVFVSRPLTFAMATCWLAGRPATDVWSLLEDGPPVQTVTLDPDSLRNRLDGLKAGA